MTYQSRDRIASAVVLLLTVGGFVHISSLPPGAAMFPTMVLGLAALLSSLWLISTFLPRKAPATADGETPATKPFMDNPKNLGIFIALIVAYLTLIDIIGYFTSTALFIVVTALALGFRRTRYLAIGVVLFVAFVYFVFVTLFNRPLPVEFFQQ